MSSDRSTTDGGAFYATTPIFYVNAEPHIGHAYTTILVDVATRYRRLAGDDVYFLTGTDEHGENIQKAADAAGMSPQAYTDRVAGAFRDAWDKLDIRYDAFIRTTEERHKKVVREVLQRVYDQGDIIYGEYGGLYCVRCERYYTEKELGDDGLCPQHEIAPEYRSEANYFFRMEKYRPWLREQLETNPDLIRPAGYRSEVLSMLKEPIGDLSISRPRSRVPWGIPLPWDEEHVTYVWFDALINYYSAVASEGLEDRYWPHVEHFIAKDIVKPHGVFWPTMLKAAGIPLYQHLNVHGYWLIEDRKMSKSLGNVVRPLDLAERYGNDAFRYFLMRDMTFGLDASFHELGLAERINSDLANDLGNLLNRTLGMLGKYRDGVVPAFGPLDDAATELRDAFLAIPPRLRRQIEELQFDRAIAGVMEAVRKANKYVSDAAPWQLAKDPEASDRLDTVLRSCLEALRCASVLLDPVLPGKMAELRRQLGTDANVTLADAERWDGLPDGTVTQRGDPLFPRIDLHALKATMEGAASTAGAVPDASADGAAATDDADPAPPVAFEQKPEIDIDAFAKLDLRVGEVIACEAHPKADRLLVLTVRVGTDERTIVSGIREHYAPEELVGRKVVIIANLAPVKLRGVWSQGMVLSAEDPDGRLSLVALHRDAPAGSEVR
ncbi:MAG: methionine--tRNA ligase [Trueperaceae bacterium]